MYPRYFDFYGDRSRGENYPHSLLGHGEKSLTLPLFYFLQCVGLPERISYSRETIPEFKIFYYHDQPKDLVQQWARVLCAATSILDFFDPKIALRCA